MANFSQIPKRWVKRQVFGTLLTHPTALLPSQVSLVEFLWIVVEEEQLKALSELYLGPRTTSNIAKEEFDVSHVAERVRKILRKFSHICGGALGEINTTEHRIELFECAKPIS